MQYILTIFFVIHNVCAKTIYLYIHFNMLYMLQYVRQNQRVNGIIG